MTMKASFMAKIKTVKCVMNPHAPNVGLICLEMGQRLEFFWGGDSELIAFF